MEGHHRSDILALIMRKALIHEHIEREEVRQALNYLWDECPRSGRLAAVRLSAALLRNPTAILWVPAFASMLAHNMTPEVLCGLYDSYKDHALFKEEETAQRLPHVLSSTGTGGKEVRTINVSTASAIVAASSGSKVLRTGTRSVYGTGGASDFLEASGLPMVKDVTLVGPLVEAVGLAFMDGDSLSTNGRRLVDGFAKSRDGIRVLARTLSHPFRHAICLLKPLSSEFAHRGISLPVTKQVAEALRYHRGFKRGVVVYGQDNAGRRLDEFSNVGPTQVCFFEGDSIETTVLWPQDIGLPLRQREEIEVHDRRQGYGIVRALLKGERVEGDPHAELVAFNAGGMLYAAGLASSIREGVKMAMAAIREGLPYVTIERYKQAYRDLSSSLGRGSAG